MIPQIFRQRHIDSGQIGGLISVFINSMFIFSFFTFINTAALVYQSILKYHLSLTAFGLIIGVSAVIWMGFYYSIVMPSQQQFASRQSYIHNNPVQKDLKELKDSMDQLKKDMEFLKTCMKLNGR